MHNFFLKARSDPPTACSIIYKLLSLILHLNMPAYPPSLIWHHTLPHIPYLSHIGVLAFAQMNLYSLPSVPLLMLLLPCGILSHHSSFRVLPILHRPAPVMLFYISLRVDVSLPSFPVTFIVCCVTTTLGLSSIQIKSSLCVCLLH